MALIKNGEFIDDPWIPVPEIADLPANGKVMVTFELWQEHREDLLKRGGDYGIRLKSKYSPEEIAEDLKHFKVVALEFPLFKSGRGLSYARILREHYEYKGEIRAVGQVLRDQFLFMHRCGFDAFEVDETRFDIDDWKEALAEISIFYQATKLTPRSVLRRP